MTMEQLLEALRTINRLHNLGDQVYAVRRNAVENGLVPDGMNSWEAPQVIEYSDAVALVEKFINAANFEEETPVQPAAHAAQVVTFTNDGTSEQQFIEHGKLSCPHCGGSGHRGDVAAAPAVEVDDAMVELERLRALINSPELHDFAKGVSLEATHQRERWGSDHDAGKEPQDWFWLVGYLGGKALRAHLDGNTEKALHHTISTAAALCNWHGAINGAHNMRPGIDDERGFAAALKQEG